GVAGAMDGREGAVRAPRDPAQMRLDLLGLEPVAVQVDLTVQPPRARDRAVVGIDRAEVAGAVGASAIRKREERARPRGRGLEITRGDLRSRDDDLATCAVRQAPPR